MPTRRTVTLLTLLAAGLCSGCATFNDRFHVPGRDPLLAFLGVQYDTTVREWPAVSYPELRPMRTELIPDRLPPKGTPHPGWPPL